MEGVEVFEVETQSVALKAEACAGLEPKRPEPLVGLRWRALLGAVFAVSLSVLTFEIALTRLFAAVLAYHFVFVAVSVGLLGLGLGGVLLAGLPREQDGAAALRRMGTFAFGEAAALILALLFFLRYPNADRLLPFALAALPPFLLAGLFLALALRRCSAAGSRVYFADLFGAATGSLAAVLLLQTLGPPATVLLLAGMVALAGAVCLLMGGGRLLAGAVAVLGVVVLVLAAVNPQAPWLQMELARKRSASKHLLTLMAEGGLPARQVSTSWDAYARTDVIDLGEGETAKRVIFTDGGSAAAMPRFRKTAGDAEHVVADVGLLPYLQGNKDRVLIIGPGGGLDVLLALLGGARDVTAVEVNAAAVRAVEQFADYNGGLYRYRNVKVVVGEGRNYVRASPDRYDLISLPLVVTQAAETVGFSLVENYVFTVQAFQDYLAHLRPGGRLVVKAHDIRDLTRTFVTALAALERQGKSPAEAARHLLAFQRDPQALRDPTAVMYPLLILRDTPYSAAEAEQAFALGVAAGLAPLFVPGVYELPVFRGLASGEQSPQAFVTAFPARVGPTTDDSPFFYEYARPLPAHLLWLLGGVTILALLVIGFVGNIRRRETRRRARWSPVVYFAALGGAFMLVEIPVLQRSIFALGYPTLAFSVVLFALLTGAGTGSFVSAWVADEDLEGGMTGATLLAGVLAAVWLWGAPVLLERWLGASLLSRSLITMGLLFPLGFAMGIPFPLGIRLLKREGEEAAVPWMWAVNGVVSVVASVGAVVIAIAAGFSWAMALGGLLYVAAAGLARFGLGWLGMAAQWSDGSAAPMRVIGMGSDGRPA